MVIDTSALIAIFFEEPGCTDLVVAIEQSEHAYISTATLLEIYMVFFGKVKSEEQEKWDELMSILRDLGVSVVPFAEND